MNYIKLYNNIICLHALQEKSVNTEIHHIIPRCIGGQDIKSNLVIVSPRVHYLLHLLLWKMYPKGTKERESLASAVFCMSKLTRGGKRIIKVNSKLYEQYSLERRMALKKKCKQWGGVQPGVHCTSGHTGHKHSLESRKKMSKPRTKRENFFLRRNYYWAHNPITIQNIHVTNGQQPPNGFIKGRYVPEEQLKRFIKLSTGRKLSEEHKQKLREIARIKKYKHSEETKQKIRDAFAKREYVVCPYCGKRSQSISAMKQFHFENCKFKKLQKGERDV